MNWFHTEYRGPTVDSEELPPNKPFNRPLVLVSELYFTGSNQGCQCLQSEVGRHFPVSQGQDFVLGAPKPCPQKSKPGFAGAIMSYRLPPGTKAVTACLYRQGDRTR